MLRVKIRQQMGMNHSFRNVVLTTRFCRVLMKYNHLLGTDSSPSPYSGTATKQLTAFQHREELLCSSKEATRIIHVHKEWAEASLPGDSPVISTRAAQCYLPSLGSLDHSKHGFKSVTQTSGPAAAFLMSGLFLLRFYVLLALIQLSQQKRI